MMRELYNALPLPDERPITSICIVEDLSGCPPNYCTVSKSHDQDIDADLYKDGFFKKVTRYLCHSKTEGFFGYIVENIKITNDRESRPAGYTMIDQTNDTSQKAFKKKQLCYKAVPRSMAQQIITDIIILSRSKIAPAGFTLVGELNGLCICYKPGVAAGAIHNNAQLQQQQQQPILPYSMTPNSSTERPGPILYPGLQNAPQVPPPTRPAPMPPSSSGVQHIPLYLPPRSAPFPPHTIDAAQNAIYGPGCSALFGVPFQFNPKYVNTTSGTQDLLTDDHKVKSKSVQQVEDEFYYSFTLERDTLNRTAT